MKQTKLPTAEDFRKISFSTYEEVDNLLKIARKEAEKGLFKCVLFSTYKN